MRERVRPRRVVAQRGLVPGLIARPAHLRGVGEAVHARGVRIAERADQTVRRLRAADRDRAAVRIGARRTPRRAESRQQRRAGAGRARVREVGPERQLVVDLELICQLHLTRRGAEGRRQHEAVAADERGKRGDRGVGRARQRDGVLVFRQRRAGGDATGEAAVLRRERLEHGADRAGRTPGNERVGWPADVLHDAVQVVGVRDVVVDVGGERDRGLTDQRLHRAVHELELARVAVVGSDAARQRRDELRAQCGAGLIVLQRGEEQRRALAQTVAQLDEIADVRALAAVRIVESALVQIVLEGQRAVSGALGVQQRDPELAQRSGLTDLEVVLVEGPVRRRELRLPGLRGLERAEVDRAAQRSGLRAKVHTRAGEEVGVDRAQVRRGAWSAQRDPVERHRGLRLVATAQRDRLRRVGIVGVLRHVDAADRGQGVGERVGDAAHRARVVDVGGRHGDPRAHRADDLEAAGVGGARAGLRGGRLLHAQVDVDGDLLVAQDLERRRGDAGVAALAHPDAVDAARDVGVLHDPALGRERAGDRRADEKYPRVSQRNLRRRVLDRNLDDAGVTRALRARRNDRADRS